MNWCRLFFYKVFQSLTLAFQAGAGIELNNSFVLGVNFYHLGTSRIQGSDNTEFFSDYYGDDFETQFFRFNDVTPMLLMARLGVKFGK